MLIKAAMPIARAKKGGRLKQSWPADWDFLLPHRSRLQGIKMALTQPLFASPGLGHC
jgi:hypothetical protein